MKLQHTLALVYSFGALTLTGCPTLKEMAEKATETVGTPFVVLTTEEDKCAKEQMMAFYDEFKEMDAQEQEKVREAASHYSKIEIRPSVNTGYWEGRSVKVQLTQRDCYGIRRRRCYDTVLETRTVTSPTFRGSSAGLTRIDNEGYVAGFAAEQEVFAYVSEIYEFRDFTRFNNFAPSEGRLRVNRNVTGSRCGVNAHLRDVIVR